MEQTKRLNVELSVDEHKEIKNRATNRGISITKWVKRAIQEAINREKRYE